MKSNNLIDSILLIIIKLFNVHDIKYRVPYDPDDIKRIYISRIRSYIYCIDVYHDYIKIYVRLDYGDPQTNIQSIQFCDPGFFEKLENYIKKI